MKKEWAMVAQGVLAATGAYWSAKIGVLFPVLCVLAVGMAIDFITGMLASKVEAIEHPDDPDYGWSSKKGAKGIAKKAGYLAAVAAGIMVDILLLIVSAEFEIGLPGKTLFGLLVAIWVLLNELISITENAGRMGADLPEWQRKYIAALRDKIDKQAE